MNARQVLTASTLALVLLLGGCAVGRPLHPAFTAPSASSGTISFHITNLNFTQATIYGVTTGNRLKLGVVEGKKDRVLTMPLTSPTFVRLEINLLAGPVCSTEELSADPGDDFDLVILQGGSNLDCRIRS